MATYTDTHSIERGVTFENVSAAHLVDLLEPRGLDMNHRRYGVDRANGNLSCLAEAPSAGTAAAVHHEAHCPLADEIFEVQESS